MNMTTKLLKVFDRGAQLPFLIITLMIMLPETTDVG